MGNGISSSSQRGSRPEVNMRRSGGGGEGRWVGGWRWWVEVIVDRRERVKIWGTETAFSAVACPSRRRSDNAETNRYRRLKFWQIFNNNCFARTSNSVAIMTTVPVPRYRRDFFSLVKNGRAQRQFGFFFSVGRIKKTQYAPRCSAVETRQVKTYER